MTTATPAAAMNAGCIASASASRRFGGNRRTGLFDDGPAGQAVIDDRPSQ